MVTVNPNTTWIGPFGGGISGSLLAGGSAFRIDLWHMGWERDKARVLVTGERVGLVAEAGSGMCVLIVTGCGDPRQMDGLISSGIDWEFAVGLRVRAAAGIGAKIANAMKNEIVSGVTDWAMHSSAKEFVNWAYNNVVNEPPKGGPEFKLIPWPMAMSVGAGLFYERQTLQLLRGRTGWNYIKPRWSVHNGSGCVYLTMTDIPEQDGTSIRIGFAVPEYGFDPVIRFGDHSWSRNYIVGVVYSGQLMESRTSFFEGINLTKRLPVGMSRKGFFTVGQTDEVIRNGRVRLRPFVIGDDVFRFWNAEDTVEMETDRDGRFVRARRPQINLK